MSLPLLSTKTSKWIPLADSSKTFSTFFSLELVERRGKYHVF